MKYRRMTIVYLVLIILMSAILLYAAEDFPPLTPRMAFRRLEAARLLGPSKMIDTLYLQSGSTERITLGKSDNGYTVWFWNPASYQSSSHFLYYCPKAGTSTLIDISIIHWRTYSEDWHFSFLLFTDHENAIKAKFQLNFTYDGKEETVELEALRKSKDYFLCTFDKEHLTEELFLSLNETMHNPRSSETAVLHITVYDHKGNELETITRDMTQPRI